MKSIRVFKVLSTISFLLLIGACVAAPLVTNRASAQRNTAESGKAVAIIHAKIYSDLGDAGDAVLVRGSRIAAMGKTSEIQAQCEEPCTVIDAKGGFLTPGFHDAHIHLVDAAKASSDFQTKLLSPSQLKDPGHAFQNSLKDYIQANPAKAWIYGGNWLFPGFKNQLPTKRDLDAVESTKPIVLRDFGGHELWVNSKALQLAGIDRNTPDPVGGTIVKDSHGDPTGVLLRRRHTK